MTVKAVLEDGKVVSLEVETPDETPGRGQKCSEEAFTSQFIGKTLPVTLARMWTRCPARPSPPRWLSTP